MVKPFGIKNIGSSCYANAVVQALISCKCLDGIFLDVRKLITEFGFSGQQDALEFMFSVIEKFELEKLFQSQWSIGMYCWHCKEVVANSTDSMIAVGVEKKICVKDGVNSVANFLMMNLTRLMDYKCVKCGGKKFCKVSRIEVLPKILAVYFLKYEGKWQPHSYDANMIVYGKDYALRAVIHHSGVAKGGHYTCTAVRDDGTYLFDDESFQEKSHASGENDYILIYELKIKI